MTKKNNKETNLTQNKRKWSDIKNFKKSIDIKYNDELLFTMVELKEKDLLELIKMFSDNEGKELLLTGVNDMKFVVTMIKKMVKGVDFNEMSDEDIYNEIMEFGEEVTEQINNAFKVLITDRFDRYVQNMLKNLDELNKIQEKVINIKRDELTNQQQQEKFFEVEKKKVVKEMGKENKQEQNRIDELVSKIEITE